MTSTTCSFRKTKTGEWVVFGPALIINAGRTVTVTKKDGTTKTETIETVGKSFTVDGEVCCYGYPAAKGATRRSFEAAPAKRSGRYVCDECGEWVTRGVGQCWETGCGH